MLNGPEWLAPRMLGRPSCTWWRGALWVAHLNLAQQIAVTRVDVATTPVLSASQPIGLAAEFDPALVALGDRLVLAIAAPEQPIRLFTSNDGITFNLETTLPFVSIAAATLAAGSRLWLGWLDANHMVHVASGFTGNMTDEPTALRASSAPALAAYDDLVSLPFIGMAWRDADVGLVGVARFDEDDFDPQLTLRRMLPDVGVDHVAIAWAFAHAGARPRLVVACERAEPPRTRSQDHRLFARQVDHDLTETGDIENMGLPALGPGLARGRARIWAAWRDMDQHADHLTVAPYDTLFDLPESLRELLGKRCDPRQCPPDLRIVCTATDEVEWQYEEGWIRNARKGDLVLTPASGTGLIGGFLKELEFEQLYDHMGIMLDDHRTVRHATMAHSRTDAFYVGSLLGEPAPTDGFRPDVLKYGWPGTITQSVHNAFMPWAGFNDGANPEWVDAMAVAPVPLAPGANDAQWEQFRRAEARFRGFVDPEQRKDGERVGYAFANLTWTPQLRADGRVVRAVVVKPPVELEIIDPQVRASVHRVAEAARGLRGHYRFYAYTDAAIALDSAMNGPPTADARWNDLPAGANWAAHSAAVVCSTFVWAAVQKASGLRWPRLELEGTAEPSVEEQYRAQGQPARDGLYRYRVDERRRAAATLHENVTKKVKAQVWAKLMKAKDGIGWLVTVLRWGLTTVLALFAMPVAALAALLGIRLENAGMVLLWLNDMPDDVANQMVNTFASDRPERKDDRDWENPGEGRSVAPHDILTLWDEPRFSDDHTRMRHGLWGRSEPLILPEPRHERRRVHVWDRASGLSMVSGQVLHRSGDVVVGAQVRIGCETTLSNEEGFYVIDVPAGRQEIVAGAYWPQTTLWMHGERLADLLPGAMPGMDVLLEDPPEWRRVLQIRVKFDLVHQVLVGKDDWLHESTLIEHRFTRLPDDWGDPPDGPPQVVWDQHWSDQGALITGYAGDERIRLHVKATFEPESLDIRVEVRAELVEDHSADVEASASHVAVVPKDQNRKVDISLKSGETPPDRGWINVQMFNDREVA
jgi:hypothetical protein